MDIHNLFDLLRRWPIEPVVTLTKLTGGTNNQAWLVETEGASSHVLRLASSSSEADLARFRYETTLLGALDEKRLPFHVPLPVQTTSDENFVVVEQGQATPILATLTPFLSGVVPERNASNIARAGEALAMLDIALATIPVDILPTTSGTAPFQYGDLWHCHPLVTNLFATVEQLLEPVQARPLCKLLLQAQEDWEILSTQGLPQQVLHRDCGPGNVLMEGGEVTAILDFEFAGMDRRIFDVCVAISWWPVRVMGTGQEWDLIDAFGRAYATYIPLSGEELQALPAALRLRDLTSLIYRIGRYLAGLETKEVIFDRVQHSFWREAWLMANYETLVQHAMTWKAEAWSAC